MNDKEIVSDETEADVTETSGTAYKDYVVSIFDLIEQPFPVKARDKAHVMYQLEQGFAEDLTDEDGNRLKIDIWDKDSDEVVAHRMWLDLQGLLPVEKNND